MATSKSIANITTLKGGGDPTAERATKLKTDWNSFVTFLEKRGLKGHPSLDKGVGANNMGMQYLNQFRKENPTTSLTPESITEVQGHLKNYRDFTINKLRNKQAMISDAKNPNGRYVAPDENLDYYMKDLSQVDGVPGQKTTNWRFPPEFLKTVYKSPTGQVEKTVTESKGLAQ